MYDSNILNLDCIRYASKYKINIYIEYLPPLNAAILFGHLKVLVHKWRAPIRIVHLMHLVRGAKHAHVHIAMVRTIRVVAIVLIVLRLMCVRHIDDGGRTGGQWIVEESVDTCGRSGWLHGENISKKN